MKFVPKWLRIYVVNSQLMAENAELRRKLATAERWNTKLLGDLEASKK